MGVSYVSASCVAHYSTGRGSLGAEVPLSEWRSLIVRGIPLNAITKSVLPTEIKGVRVWPRLGLGGLSRVPGPLARPEPRRLPTRLCENAATAASVPQSLLQKVRQFGDISSDPSR